MPHEGYEAFERARRVACVAFWTVAGTLFLFSCFMLPAFMGELFKAAQ